MNVHRLLLILCVLFVACSNDNTSIAPPDDNFVYPLKVGNRWSYTGTITILNSSETDSVRIDTTVTSSEVRITKTETLPGGMETFVLHERSESSLSGISGSFESENFFANRADGLYFHAYRDVGLMVLPKPGVRSYELGFANRRFRSSFELLTFVKKVAKAGTVSADTLIIEPTPIRSLPYPMRIGEQWTYRQAGAPFGIEKRIVGIETISVEAGEFECMKVEWLISLNQEIEFFDFIGSPGLIMREIIVRDVIVTTPDNPDGTGTRVDIREAHELSDVQLVP